ncbi:MAG: DMT family transporter [Rhizobiales bacterium]|nr:DMT family transporter [Hyphomicrobiales bacterium]
MMMYLLYWGLLVAWVFLLWPAFRLKGAPRVWLLIVIAAGITALVYETYMYLWSFANIRLDILLISMALGCLYGSAVLVLLFGHWFNSATLLAAVLVVIGGGMSYKWIEVSRESTRLGEVFEETNRLLFKAKFGSAEVYQNYFGPFDGAGDRYPVGHWQLDGQSHYTRLIINAEGRAWLFYQCQIDAECHSGPGGSGLRRIADQPAQWRASLKPQAGLAFDIKITRTEAGTLALEVRDHNLVFAKAPPPVDPAPAAQSMRFIGPFAHLECSGAHATVRQVWLWEDGARRHAIGIFSSLVAGRYSLHVPVIVMGEATRQAEGWRFSWQRRGRSGTASMEHTANDAILTLDIDGRDVEDADKLMLKSGGFFNDERIELAPLTNAADWQHWFDNVLTGHFVSGDVPVC